MKNKLIDLNNHLFAQLERLSDEATKGDALNEEISRAKAVVDVAKEIINNGKLALDAEKTIKEWGINQKSLPPMLHSNGNGK